VWANDHSEHTLTCLQWDDVSRAIDKGLDCEAKGRRRHSHPAEVGQRNERERTPRRFHCRWYTRTIRTSWRRRSTSAGSSGWATTFPRLEPVQEVTGVASVLDSRPYLAGLARP